MSEEKEVSIAQNFTPFGQRPELAKTGEDGSSLIRDRNGVLIWTNKNNEPILLPDATLAKPLLVTNTECAVWNNRFFDYDNYAEKPQAEVIIYRRSASGGTNIDSSTVIPLQGKAVLETSPVTPVTFGFNLVTTERFDNGDESVAIPVMGTPQNVDVWDGIRMRTYRLAWNGDVQRVGTFVADIPKDGDDPNFEYLGYGSDNSMVYNLRIGVDRVSGVGDDATPGYWSDSKTYWIGEDVEIRQVPDRFSIAEQFDFGPLLPADHIRGVYVSNRRAVLVQRETDELDFADPLNPVAGPDGELDPDDRINDYRRQVDQSIAYANTFDYYSDLAAPGNGAQGRILPLALYSDVSAPIYAYSVEDLDQFRLYTIGGTMEEVGAPVTLPVPIGNAPSFVRNPADASVLLRSESNETGVVWVRSTLDVDGNVTGLEDPPFSLADSEAGLPLFVSNEEAVVWNNGTAPVIGGGVIPTAQITHYHVPVGDTVPELTTLTPPILGRYVLTTPPLSVDPDDIGWYVTTFEKSTSDPRTALLRTYRLTVGTIDADGDGISDEDEINIYGTNPAVADTDGDGLTDGQEVFPFQPVDGSFTWEESRILAGQAGGRLATPDSADNQNALVKRLATKPGGANYWIGANDLLAEGDINWVTTAGTVAYEDPSAALVIGSSAITLSKPLPAVTVGMRVYGNGITPSPAPTVTAVSADFTTITISAPALSNQPATPVRFAPPLGGFTNWAPGSPNNINDADAVQVTVGFGIPWSSAVETERQGYIVQFSATDPLLADTDGDGVEDDNDRAIDTDGDGAPDWLEVEILGTDPTTPDYGGGGGGGAVNVADPNLMTTYEGLIYEVGLGVVGEAELRITRNGRLTFKTTAFDDRATGRGAVNPTNGVAAFEVRTSSRRSVFANLVVRTSPLDPSKYVVSGTLGTPTDPQQQVMTLQPVAYSRFAPSPQAGDYTMAFLNPGAALATPGTPAGDGVGTARISTTGMVSIRGYLADGSRFNYRGNLLLGNQVPFFVPIGSAWRPQGGAAGYLSFRNIPNASDFDGSVRFTRQPSYGLNFQAGYDYFAQAIGNRWIPAGFSNWNQYGISSSPNNAALQFEGGVLAGEEVFVTLDSRGSITTPRTQTRMLSMRLNSRSGEVSGRYLYNDPENGYARTSSTIQAVALPKLGEIRGMYAAGGDAGYVQVVPNDGGSLPPVTQIAPRVQLVPDSGLTYKIYVTASEPWRVEIPADVNWLLATPTSGTSDGEVLITVGRNFLSAERETVIFIAGLAHAVIQKPTSNPVDQGDQSVSINPSFALVPAEGASYFVTVESDPPISGANFDPLDYVSPVTWAVVTPMINTTTGQLIGAQVDVEANDDVEPRFTDLVIGGLTHRLDQEGADQLGGDANN